MSVLWVRVLAALGASLVVLMSIHAVATLTLLGWVYPLLCAYMTFAWWKVRHTSADAARGIDGLFLAGLFFVARVAEPAFIWLDSLF